jgi:hypothetical protein
MRLQLALGTRVSVVQGWFRGLRALGVMSLLGVTATAFAADKGPPSDKGSPPDKPKGSGLKTTASLETSGYTDTDHVLVASPTVAGSIGDDLGGWSIGGRYLVDVVSAASVDIVSNASNKWHEVRNVGSANASAKAGDATFGASGIVSSEPDYLSLAGGVTLSLDMLDKNVTPFVGYSHGQDSVGRTGLPHEFWKSLQTNSVQLGLTFVMSRSTIASLQGDGVFERGYLAKPYRYIPLFAPGKGASVAPGTSADQVNADRLPERPAEQVPSARDRYAITGRIAHRMESSTIRLDERGYWDSWSMLASTTDARIMFDLGRYVTLWPHLRFHIQNHASFWQRAYEVIPGPNGTFGVPAIRAGDRELSPLYTGIAGMGIRWKLTSDPRKSWSLVYEIDAGYTRYLDALYITERRMLFTTLAVEAELD